MFSLLKTRTAALLSLLAAGLLLYGTAAAQEAEFDGSQLHPVHSQAPIDVSRFRFGNPIAAGQYHAEIYVNGTRRGEALLRFTENRQSPIGGLCLEESWFKLLDVLPQALTQPLKQTASGCLNAPQAMPQLDFAFDTATQRLNVTIPQALTMRRPRGYIDPAQWQNGVPAAFLHYRLSNRYHRYDGQSHHDNYLNLRTGFNQAGWAVRHQGTFRRHNGTAGRYRHYETYVERSLDPLRSRLTLGDFFTRSDINETTGMRGIMLTADRRMLPLSQRGFAPTVRGMAATNATVRIRQNGHIIYETAVPAGPFVIDDLYPASGGDLDVEVSEENGQSRRFSLPFAHSAYLIRPRQWDFQAAFGRYRETGRLFKLPVFQGALQYGISNSLTLQSALTGSRHHWDARLGTLWNTRIGILEGQAAFSQLQLPSSRTLKGSAFSLNWQKHLAQSGTYLNLGFSHHPTGRYYGIRDAAYSHRNPQWQPASDGLKQHIRLSVNQSLGDKIGQLYINGSSSRYRRHRSLLHEYQLGYGNQYKNWQYRLGYSQARHPNGKRDNQFYLNLSLLPDDPSRTNRAHHLISADYSRSNSHTTLRTAISGSKGALGYGLSALRHRSAYSYSAYGSYKTPYFNLNINTSTAKNSRQLAYTASGALVAHPHGLTAAAELGETFGIIHAKGATGATVNGQSDSRIDRWGNAIVPHLLPYQINRVSINPQHLPDDVELSATAKEVIPRANSTALIDFATRQGQIILFELQPATDRTPPLGAEILDAQQRVVGYVVQGQRAFVRGIDNEGTLTVAWGTGSTQQCRFSYRLNFSHQAAPDARVPSYTVTCHP